MGCGVGIGARGSSTSRVQAVGVSRRGAVWMLRSASSGECYTRALCDKNYMVINAARACDRRHTPHVRVRDADLLCVSVAYDGRAFKVIESEAHKCALEADRAQNMTERERRQVQRSHALMNRAS